jgi:nitrile hydratase
MKEFGLEIPENVRVAVHDSSADFRYMVLPMRPRNTQGMNEEELTGLITRDALIGVSVPLEPVRTG